MTVKDRHNFVDVETTKSQNPDGTFEYHDREYGSYAAVFYIKREDVLAFIDALGRACKAEPQNEHYARLRAQFKRVKANKDEPRK